MTITELSKIIVATIDETEEDLQHYLSIIFFQTLNFKAPDLTLSQKLQELF